MLEVNQVGNALEPFRQLATSAFYCYCLYVCWGDLVLFGCDAVDRIYLVLPLLSSGMEL